MFFARPFPVEKPKALALREASTKSMVDRKPSAKRREALISSSKSVRVSDICFCHFHNDDNNDNDGNNRRRGAEIRRPSASQPDEYRPVSSIIGTLPLQHPIPATMSDRVSTILVLILLSSSAILQLCCSHFAFGRGQLGVVFAFPRPHSWTRPQQRAEASTEPPWQSLSHAFKP